MAFAILRIITAAIIFLSVSGAYAQNEVMQLVKRVQLKSSEMHVSIQSLGFKGTSRAYSYGRWDAADMKLISETEEYRFEGLWSRPDSVNITVKALRKTMAKHPFYYNSEFSDPEFLHRLNREYPLPNPIQFTYDVSSIGLDRGTRRGKGGERIDIWPVFPFAAGADSLYTYEFVSRIGLDSKELIKLFVSPRYDDIPGVAGSFYIDPQEDVVVRSDVVFNDAARMFMEGNDNGMHTPATNPFVPMTLEEDHRIKIEKALFYSSYWLPVTIEEDFTFEVMGFMVTVNRIVRYDYYDVNPENPSARRTGKLVYDIDPEQQKQLEKGLSDPHTLSPAERDSIISSAAQRKTMKVLNTDICDMESLAKDAYRLSLEQRSSKLFRMAGAWGEYFRYNRVEGPMLNYGLTFSNFVLDNTSLSAKAGYGFGDRRISGELSAIRFFGNSKIFFAEGSLFRTTGFEEDRNRFSDGKVMFSSLFFGTDYRDYYYKTGGAIGLGLLLSDQAAVKISYNGREENSAEKTTDFSVFRNDRRFRPNPVIDDGWNSSIKITSLYRRPDFNFDLQFETSGGSLLGGDFSFSMLKVRTSLEHEFNELSKLEIHATAGLSSGGLPPQRWFDIGGKSLFNYSGVLRGTGYKEFTGDRMAMGTFGYVLRPGKAGDSFRGKSIRQRIAQFFKITVWTGFGWTDFDDYTSSFRAGVPMRTTNGLYREAGIGIGDQMNMLRFDFVRNSVSDNRVLFSINVFR